ncbi:MAG: MMPL family transporter [Crocinitomicaceae bacterium]
MFFTRKKSIFFIILFTLIAGVQAFFATKTGFDHNFDTFFPEEGDDREYFEHFREVFGSENDFLIIGVHNDSGIFNEKFLTQVDSFTRVLGKLKDIEFVQSPTNLNFVVKDMFGAVYEIPYIHIHDREKLLNDSIQLMKSSTMVGSFISDDAKSISIYVKHKDNLDVEESIALLENLQKTTDEFQFDQTHMGGRIVGHIFFTDLTSKEIVLLVAASVVLIIIFLFITFKSWYGILIPFGVVALTVIFVVGLMGETGKNLNIVLNALPTVLMVVGISGVVHFLSKYLQELRKGLHKFEALKKTLKEVGFALAFTSTTTIVGFASLTTSNIPPIITFGLYTAIGVAFCLILSLVFMPSILYLMKEPKLDHTYKEGKLWDHKLRDMFLWLIRHKKLVLSSFGILLAVSIYGTFQIKPNNYIMEDLKEDNPMMKSYNFLENNFAGARPFELGIQLKDTSKSVYDPDIVRLINEIEEFAIQNYNLGGVFSIAMMAKSTNVGNHGGMQEYFELPEKDKELKKILKDIRRYADKDKLNRIIDSTQHETRISARMGDLGSYNTAPLHAKFLEFINQPKYNDVLDVHITGGPYLMELNNEMLVNNVLMGLIIAFVIIGIIIGLMYRSFVIIILTLIPNIIPLLMVAGIMGYFNIDLKLSTSIVFTIAFGIAVDDTIHFLSKYRIELKKGFSKMIALKNTFEGTGKAIVLTTIVLSGGFLTLCVSDYLGSFYIGILVSLTLVFALLSDLVLLPVLLILFYNPKIKKK